MSKFIKLFLIIALVFTAGCGNKRGRKLYIEAHQKNTIEGYAEYLDLSAGRFNRDDIREARRRLNDAVMDRFGEVQKRDAIESYDDFFDRVYKIREYLYPDIKTYLTDAIRIAKLEIKNRKKQKIKEFEKLLLARKEQLKSGEVKIENIVDAALFHDASTDRTLIATPIIGKAPANKYFKWSGILEQKVKGFYIVRLHSERPWKFGFLPGKEFTQLRANSRVTVVGVLDESRKVQLVSGNIQYISVLKDAYVSSNR